MKRKIKKYKIISHIVWMVIVITLISIIVSMNDKKIYRGARYLESPDRVLFTLWKCCNQKTWYNKRWSSKVHL